MKTKKYVKPKLNWKPKPIKRKNLVEKLDEIVSLIIRKRDEKCVQCGSRDRLTNGHVFSRSHHSTRWDISEDGNCHTQCWPHNYKHTFDQYEYFEWYKRKFGEEALQNLRRRWHSTIRKSDKELKELLENLKHQHYG